MKIFAALFFAVAIPAAAQRIEVPHKLDFAGMTLIIRDDARKDIQKDVDALTASPRHFQIKVERAKTYFPLIEKVFREEGVPDDFKYLALQESALIPDAVSSSNAVGFWQFKDFTAAEMGLRVDRQIDERLNIVSSSRAAARYLLKNNQYFDNWIYALQAYQMGAGGVMKSVNDTQAGAKRMEITGKTYWYVKRFLAHKIAYEGAIKGTPQMQVVPFENRGHITLDRLAKEAQVDRDALGELNKWAKSGVIPDDRTYVVLLPVEGASVPDVAALRTVGDIVTASTPVVRTQGPEKRLETKKINGVRTIRAAAGENAAALARRGQVDLSKFLRWNDLAIDDRIIEGQLYFLGRKRLKGSEDFHKVAPGESLWSISQRYGIQLKRLLRYNRLDEGTDAATGTMLYLASRRPKADPVLARVEDPVEVSHEETFSWAVTPQAGDETLSGETIHPAPQSEDDAGTTEPEEEPVVMAVKGTDSLKILQTNKTAVTLEDTAADVPSPIPASGIHTVQAGETLYGIARRYGLGVMDLAAINGLSLQEGIHPGQVLRLATGQEEAQTPAASGDAQAADHSNQEFYHEVKTSDTLYSIARQYNVTIKQIMEWNEKKDFSLSVGEKLKILRGQ